MNTRSAQVLAAVLGFLLILLIGTSIFILLNQHQPRATLAPVTAPPSSSFAPAGPTFPPTSAEPTASEQPSPTPVPTRTRKPPPSPSPTASTEPTPTEVPTPTPSPTEPPTPTPSPTPAPTITPTSPQREIRITNLGLDNHDAANGSLPRYVNFSVDGPSLISAHLSNVSAGQVRLCVWQGNDVTQKACRNLHSGVVQQPSFASGASTWHVSLIGTDDQISPYVTLKIDFNALNPSVQVTNLRYQGMPIDNYNGLTAEVDVADDGTLQVDGAFDAGQQHDFQVTIAQLGQGGGTVYDQSGGPANSFSVPQQVSAGASYRVTIANPNPQAEEIPVFLSATFSWP